MKILDCTLRDGGYYTNWDFEKHLVDLYIQNIDLLPIDYVEVGYRSTPPNTYMGEYGYCPIYRLKNIRSLTNKKIAIMLNEKDVSVSDLEYLTKPIIGIVDMVRLAIDPTNIERAITLAKKLKEQGFEISFNIMYISKWDELDLYNTKALYQINDVADLFCMVDSFGGMNPSYFKKIINKIKEVVKIPLGFHAHNNLELALANTLVAIDEGVEFIDSTISGMGRGAGNLKTELLLTYLNKENGLNVNFDTLGNIVHAFSPLLSKCNWGTNLPYMISGANSFPQKEVMAWVNNRAYSFNSIVKALNDRMVKATSKEYLMFNGDYTENVLIVGGGENALIHFDAIKEFINQNQDIVIIHATTRNARIYQTIDKEQYFCLSGNEAQRMKQIFKDHHTILGKCVIAPSPRALDVEVPSYMENKTYELKSISFTDQGKDSCTSLALQLALDLNAQNIYMVGYDGYPNGLSQKENDLSKENEILISEFIKNKQQLISLTPTLYNDLSIESIYSKI